MYLSMNSFAQPITRAGCRSCMIGKLTYVKFSDIPLRIMCEWRARDRDGVGQEGRTGFGRCL
jgi:hypothetical protein